MNELDAIVGKSVIDTLRECWSMWEQKIFAYAREVAKSKSAIRNMLSDATEEIENANDAEGINVP